MAVSDRVRKWFAARRASRPERLARRAEAKRHRIEMKRRHESDTRGGTRGGTR